MAKPNMSVADLESTATDLVQNAIALEPELATLVMAEKIVEGADHDFLIELGRSLMVQHFARLIRAERAKQRRGEQLRFPGFERLPVRITGRGDRKVRLEEATYSDVRRYCWLLGSSYRDRKRDDPKLAEAKELRDRMQKASRKHRGIRVGELLQQQ